MGFDEKLQLALGEAAGPRISSKDRWIIADIRYADWGPAPIWSIIPFDSLDDAYDWVSEQRADMEKDLPVGMSQYHAIRKAGYLACFEGETGVQFIDSKLYPCNDPIDIKTRPKPDPGMLPDEDEWEENDDYFIPPTELQIATKHLPSGRDYEFHAKTGNPVS